MRNSTQKDIENIRNGGEMPYDVMFLLRTQKVKVHRKHHSNPWTLQNPDVWCLIETSDGETIYTVNPSAELEAINSQGQQENVNPKKKHVKGTRPELGYDSERVAIGKRVVCRNGDVDTIIKVLDRIGDDLVYLAKGGAVWFSNGRKWPKETNKRDGGDIVRILDNPKQPAKTNEFETEFELLLQAYFKELGFIRCYGEVTILPTYNKDQLKRILHHFNELKSKKESKQ